MMRLVQPPKGAQTVGASVGLLTATGGGVAGPLAADRPSRLNRPCGNWSDTPEYLQRRVFVGHLSVAEVEYPNLSAAFDAHGASPVAKAPIGVPSAELVAAKRPLLTGASAGPSQTKLWPDPEMKAVTKPRARVGRHLPRHLPSETNLWPHPEMKTVTKLREHLGLQLPRRSDEHGERP